MKKVKSKIYPLPSHLVVAYCFKGFFFYITISKCVLKIAMCDIKCLLSCYINMLSYEDSNV